mmetsp:Transcript_4963/g.11870  ORF Transcript_4963/g.11870 Transcript_4963/m.11870 type:complete len:227 (+) Transcript_4963:1313-1993(+)
MRGAGARPALPTGGRLSRRSRGRIVLGPGPGLGPGLVLELGLGVSRARASASERGLGLGPEPELELGPELESGARTGPAAERGSATPAAPERGPPELEPGASSPRPLAERGLALVFKMATRLGPDGRSGRGRSGERRGVWRVCPLSCVRSRARASTCSKSRCVVIARARTSARAPSDNNPPPLLLGGARPRVRSSIVILPSLGMLPSTRTLRVDGALAIACCSHSE